MYVLETPLGPYQLNATFRPQQNSAGGAARARMVGGFGSGDWFRVEDGFNEPQPYVMTGQVWSDRDGAAVAAELQALTQFVPVATRLINGDAHLELDGGAAPQFVPIDPTLVEVTLILWATRDTWLDQLSQEVTF